MKKIHYLYLHCWLPERDELKSLKYTPTNKTDDDYIYLEDDEIYLLLNKKKKGH